MNNFAMFILSYNKPDKIPTLEALKKYKIKNTIYIVVGKDDPSIEKYKKNKEIKLLIFDKKDYISKVDELGTYRYTHKVCTYARQFVDDYARKNNIKYVCILFDDILNFRFRYIKNDKIKGTYNFNFNKVIELYINLLNCSKSVVMVGPPSSSYYIGINKEKAMQPASHYGNMFIYDIDKPIGPFVASVLEDMTIVLQNTERGNVCLFPFGLQVNCRKPMATQDAYKGINKKEYVMQHIIMTKSLYKNTDKVRIPYSKFSPKLINEVYKK